MDALGRQRSQEGVVGSVGMGDRGRRRQRAERGHQGDPGGGTIPESGVLGRAFVVVWPLSRMGVLNIPATFEQPALSATAAGPLALGFIGAVPLTWLQRRVRIRRNRRAELPREGVRCEVKWSLPRTPPARAPG